MYLHLLYFILILLCYYCLYCNSLSLAINNPLNWIELRLRNYLITNFTQLQVMRLKFCIVWLTAIISRWSLERLVTCQGFSRPLKETQYTWAETVGSGFLDFFRIWGFFFQINFFGWSHEKRIKEDSFNWKHFNQAFI